MTGYDNYVKKIREGGAPADFDGMRQAIGRKLIERQRARARGALAGVVAVLMIGSAVYFSYPLTPGSGGQLFSYVFEQQDNPDSPVIDYVFSDAGTF